MLLIQNINEVMIEVIFMTSDGRVIHFEKFTQWKIHFEKFTM